MPDSKPSDEMLKDGSNPEGIDPVPPLNWVSKEDLGSDPIIIYGSALSPPVQKIRYHLSFAGVDYRCVNRQPNSQPKGHYQKIPSINVNGRTINDSYIIVKNLLPTLYPTTQEEDGAKIKEWEEKITFGLQLAMEIETMEDPSSRADLLALFLGGYPRMAKAMSFTLGWLLPIGAPGRKIPKSMRETRAKQNKKYGALKTFREYLLEFADNGISNIKDASDENPSCFFGGSTSPSPVDISFYATMKSFYTLPFVKKSIEDANLSAWWNEMEKAMPESVSKDKFEKE